MSENHETVIETNPQTPEAPQPEKKAPKKKNRRLRKTIGKIIKTILLLIILAALALFGYKYYLTKQNSSTETTKLVSQTVLFGEMEDTVYGTGTTSAKNQPNITAETEGTLTDLRVEVGDTVKKGDILAVIENEDLDDEITNLEYTLWKLDDTITDTKAGSQVTEIESPAAGRIMAVYANVGDDALAVFRREGSLAIISTDGRMKVEIDGVESVLDLALNENVMITGKGCVTDGTVTDLTRQGTHAVITILSDEYTMGTEVTVTKEDGTVLGQGTLEVNKPMAVSSFGGTIKNVYAQVGKEVKRTDVLFRLEDSPLTLTMENLRIQREEAAKNLQNAKDKREALIVVAPCDGTIASLDVSEGDDITDNMVLGTILEGEEMELTISVDELDVVSVAVGQPVTITIDALPDASLSGEVYKIAPTGTNSGGVTTYGVQLAFDATGTGVRSGMNATGEIQIAHSDGTTYVPVEAIVTMRGNSYVMLVDGEGSGSSVSTLKAPAASASDASGQKPSMPTDGSMPSMPTDGSMPSMPTDGSMPSMPTDGSMPSMPSKAADSTVATETATESATGIKGFINGVITKVKAWLYSDVKQAEATPNYTLVKVETGMQNDDYVEILSGVTAGQTILMTSDSSASSSTSGFGGMGGMMGGMSGGNRSGGGAPAGGPGGPM